MDWTALARRDARNVVGLMSGSSCDGIDAALVRIEGTGATLRAELLAFETRPYDDAFRTRLLNPDPALREVLLLNVEVGERLAAAVESLRASARSRGIEADLVASHGHTLAHVPPSGADRVAGTLQIGEAAVIAERTGLPVVSDFRPRDMVAGGQGAPLVPYADWVLFHRPDETVVTLNIGGIANFTVIPPLFEGIAAFDTGPGNMPIDGAVRAVSKGRRQYDAGGEMAARGRVDSRLLARLLDHPFLERRPPKSTGREAFGPEVYLGAGLTDPGRTPEDLVATVTAAVGRTIADAFNRFIAPEHRVRRILVGGGGAHNPVLLERIREGLGRVEVIGMDRVGWPPDAREAIAFAILGNETVCGTPANVPSATGARRPVVLGTITPAGP